MAATFNMPLPALKRVLMASSTFDETLGRPNRFPCWRTRSGPANTLPNYMSSCSPNTDAIWIMTRPIGVEESMPC